MRKRFKKIKLYYKYGRSVLQCFNNYELLIFALTRLVLI